MTPSAESFAAALPLPALVIRRDSRIAAANAGAEGLFGPQLAGRHFVAALRQPALLEAVEACLAHGESRTAEYLGVDGAQETTWRVTASALGTREGVLVTFSDVTPLEQAGQMRRDFVANVSHELRTPLTAILGFIETLKGPAARDPGAQDRFLGIMQTEAERMNRLIDDLLSLSRVEAEERMRPTGPVCLDALVGETVRGMTQLATEAGVTLGTALPGREITVPGDADQLRQVLGNLIENGIKYSGHGSEITVGLQPPGYEPRLRAEGVRLWVADTGAGIAPHHIPRLTERFYRVDSHRSREMGGTGLGLAIVKHIVSRHRGRLRVQSAPGKGSTFTLLLPSA
jgi:two-component system phosphate regulon sensor histidine kinase PhoR